MIKTLTVSLLALALTLPSVAFSQNRALRRLVQIPVLPIDDNTFEAVVNDGAFGSLMWCAAGRFTSDYLRRSGGQLYVKRELALSTTFPGRKSVIFTTQPVPDAFNSYTESIRNPGQQFSLTHAYAICRTQEPEYFVRVRLVRP